ncbi:ATP-dependent DNA helicase RecQ [Mycena venus]|uniref:DNA 3'-5' helicase n=1 Tax=Mycena venus TaxID=2733690 RepID=A0A8H6XN58_9AGAR|nr:ATP-dependent DNA helicase RecQ [Mycena venus]
MLANSAWTRIPGWKDGLFRWQLTIVVWILDGEDVLCVTATGDGKSALFTVPIIVLLEVAANPSTYPGLKPVGIVIVISPTKGLSANMITELSAHGVHGLAYTSESLTKARKSGRNLCQEIAQCQWPIVCIDPEHLMEKQWERITDSALFRENLKFPGPPTRSVCRSLGFQKDMFHLVQRSNERPSIQFSLSPHTHGLGGDFFLDLLEYLKDNQKCVIYCATIELCWRVYIYLLRQLPPGLERLRRVHLYHAMCWLDENEETVLMIRDGPQCQIVVATVAFGQGFNIRVLLDSLMVGLPKTVAQTLQQAGRVGRDQTSNGRAVVFVQSSAYKSAEKYLAQDPTRRDQAKHNKSLSTMNNEKPLMLSTTECLIAFFNKLYDNSGESSRLDCIAAKRRLPCSNCRPQFIGPLFFPPSPLPIGNPPLAAFTAVDTPPLPSSTTTRGDSELAAVENSAHTSKLTSAGPDFHLVGGRSPNSGRA